MAQSDVLLLSSGDGLEKLASSLFSKFSDYQSERGRPPQYRVIQVWVVLFSLALSSLVLLIPNL